jgi:hypothetical protein
MRSTRGKLKPKYSLAVAAKHESTTTSTTKTKSTSNTSTHIILEVISTDTNLVYT